jgi:uncharacterized protein YciU (UPF0263 family)
MLFIISDYQKRKGVSLQFIAEYTQKGIFKKIEMPIFTELDGQKIHLGNKVLLQVPTHYLPDDCEDVQEAEMLSHKISDDPELRAVFKKMLLQKKNEAHLRKRYDRIYNKKHPKHKAYKLAIDRALDVFIEQARGLIHSADNLIETVQKESFLE